MSKVRRFQSVVLLGVILFTFIPVIALHTHVFASAPVQRSQPTTIAINPNNLDPLPSPSWWNGTACDTAKVTNSTPLGGNFRGTPACGPLNLNADPSNRVYFFSGDQVGAYEWQCVELVMRYLYLAYGIPPYSANGNTVVSNYPGTRLQKINNGTVGQVPQPGDVLSYNATKSNADGHTSIVTFSKVDSTTGNGYINVLEQNGTETGKNTIQVYNWVVTPKWTTVSGWLHDPLLLTDGIHVPSSIIMGQAFTASYTITNTGNVPFSLQALQLMALTPGGQRVPLYNDNPGNNQTSIPAGQSRTLLAKNISISPSLPNCNLCGTGTYTLFASILLANGTSTPIGSTTAEFSNPTTQPPYLTTLFTANNAHNKVQVAVHGFSIVSSPNGPCSSYLASTSTTSGSDIWAVGYYDCSSQSALIEHWNGTQWSIIPNPYPPNNTAWQLSSVSADSATDAWAVGSYSVGYQSPSYSTLIEHWNGTLWSIDSSLNYSGRLFSVKAFSPKNVWVVGYSTNISLASTLIEHWNGVKWTTVASPNIGILDVLSGVSVTSPKDIWAVGYYQASNSTTDYSLIEHYDGSQWSIVQSPITPGCGPYVTGVAATSSIDAWFVTSSNGCIQHWDGTHWNIVYSSSGNYALSGVAATSSHDVWVVGQGNNNAQPILLHWDGTQWYSVPTPVPYGSTSGFYGVAALSVSNVWIVGSDSGGTLTEQYS